MRGRLLVAALVTRLAEQLLVLLLAHALAALLNQRSHEVGHRIGPAGVEPRRRAATWAGSVGALPLAGSSIGRTPDFGSGGCRFDPCPESMTEQTPLRPGGRVLTAVLLAAGQVRADGPPDQVLSAELLESVFQIPIRVANDAQTQLPYVVTGRLSK